MDKRELLKELESLFGDLDEIEMAVERTRKYLRSIVNDVELYLIDAES